MDLSSVFKKYPPGTWVVMDPDMSEVLVAADTPEEALRLVGEMCGSGERPVIFQVWDPSIAYY